MTFDTVLEIALALPGVEEGTSYGTPALRVKKKFLARLREDGDVVFKVGFDNAEMLMMTNPAVFYTTDHYRGYPSVLVRMSRVTKKQLADVIQMAWRENAPKKLLK
jgi:hypothetical protein